MKFFGLLSWCLAALFASTLPANAAESFPSKPIRWVVPYAPGGGTDALVRLVASQMATQMGQPIVVDNRPGGATIIAASTVARAPADGYTVLTTDNGTLVFNTALFSKLPYDPKKVFEPIGLMVRFPLVLAVSAKSEISNVGELLEQIRANPGKFNYGTSGTGTPHHLAMEMLKNRAGLDVVHIPYNGAAPAIQAVLSGEIPMLVMDTAAAMAMIKADRLRPLATFAASRLSFLPEIPTLMELGHVDIEASAWQGLVAPAATPAPVIAKLSDELQKALSDPAVSTRLTELGLQITPSDPRGMHELWRRDDEVWPKLIREIGIKLD